MPAYSCTVRNFKSDVASKLWKKTELQKHWINNKSTVQLYDSTYIRFNKFTYKMYKQSKPVKTFRLKINKIGNGT